MISRKPFIQKLHKLSNYKFVAYIEQIGRDVHKVRLCIEDFKALGLSSKVYYQDFIVFDIDGKLSARSVDGAIVIDVLS